MMGKTVGALWLCLVFCFVVVTVSGSDDQETLTCNVPDYFGSYDIPLQTSAVPWPDSGTEFCGSKLSDYSCCNNVTFAAMTVSYKAAQLALNVSSTLIYEAWEALDELMEMMWDILDEETQELLEDTLGAAIDILDTFSQKYPPAVFKCAYGMLNYSVGAMCVACSGDWSKYITTSGNTVTLHFDEDTCNEVYDECSDLLDVTQELNDMFYALVEGDDDAPKICEDDDACKEYVCGTMLSGGLTFSAAIEPPPDSKKKKATSTVTNTYESGGFPAYEVGSQSKVNGDTSDSNTGKIVVICICVGAAILAAVVVIVVAALVVYKHKKKPYYALK